MKHVRSTFKNLADKPTSKKYLVCPTSRWEDNIRIDLKEIGVTTRNWIGKIQNKNYWTEALNLRVPSVMELIILILRLSVSFGHLNSSNIFFLAYMLVIVIAILTQMGF